jgi:general secretion pathway protein C
MARKKSEKTSSIRQDQAVQGRIVAAAMGRGGMNRWIFRAFKAALVCVAIYVGAGSALKIRAILHLEPGSSLASIPQPGPDIQHVAQARPRSLETYRAIWERNLFKVSEQENKEPPPQSIQVNKIAFAENNIGLKLIGTVMATDPGLSYAIIDVAATRRQAVYRENESVGAATIKEILRNTVIIDTGKGQINRLSVEHADLMNLADSKMSRTKPMEAKANSYTSQEIESSSIAVQVPLDEVKSSLSSAQIKTAAFSLSPQLSDGRLDGFTVLSPGPQNIFTRIGLQPGDLIRSVEGVQFKSPGDRVGFFKRLTDGGDFSLLTQRSGHVRLLRLEVK